MALVNVIAYLTALRQGMRHRAEAAAHYGQGRYVASVRDGADTLYLPDFFLVMGCLLQVQCELPVQPELELVPNRSRSLYDGTM